MQGDSFYSVWHKYAKNSKIHKKRRKELGGVESVWGMEWGAFPFISNEWNSFINHV
jgi:hypothetical protein